MIAAFLSVLVATVLGIWLVLSICNQIPQLKRLKLINTIVAYDVLGLVPIWTFFAPNPGNTDLHLLARERTWDGQMTPWRELQFGERRHALSLWNPLRRGNKAVVDVSSSLARQTRDRDEIAASRGVVLSFPYLLILGHVMAQPRGFGAQSVQFALARTTGYEGRHLPRIVFVSACHRIADDGLGRDGVPTVIGSPRVEVGV